MGNMQRNGQVQSRPPGRSPPGFGQIWCDFEGERRVFRRCDAVCVIVRRISADEPEFVQKVSKSGACSGWPALPAL